MDLFDQAFDNIKEKILPLGARMRPKSIKDVLGQEHLIKEGKPIYQCIKKKRLPSMIFYGPSGTGKTTLAKIISRELDYEFIELNATLDGVPRVREVIKESAELLKFNNKRTIVFIDEIHRFNKSQQDTLLPQVENGTIILLGATTENPSIAVNKALLSRLIVFRLEPLSLHNIIYGLKTGIESEKNTYDFQIDEEIVTKISSKIANYINGDMRKGFNILESLFITGTFDQDNKFIYDEEILDQLLSESFHQFNKEDHYDVASALIKSIRASKVDGALLYLGKMLASGEDPAFICRRLIISASEDIGLANNYALTMAVNGLSAIEKIGMPEARIILGHITIYLCHCKKSNSAYEGINASLIFNNHNNYEIPNYLRDHSFNRYDEEFQSAGKNEYLYPHNYPETDYLVNQEYLPKGFENLKFYERKKFDK